MRYLICAASKEMREAAPLQQQLLNCPQMDAHRGVMVAEQKLPLCS